MFWLNSFFSPIQNSQDKLDKIMGPGRMSTKMPPKAPGIYRWIDKKTREICYVGKSSNLFRRRNSHIRDPNSPWNLKDYTFAWKKATGSLEDYNKDINDIEENHIARHKPRGNRNRGRGGRIPRYPL